MPFELLANELLFDLFEYFSSVDLFHSFNGLNSRFDCLLIEYYRNKKSFNFQLISKEDLNIIRRRYLSLFINEIESIYLSDDDTNPHEIDLFITRLYPLNRFINLKSITFYKIYSIQKLLRISNDLKQMRHLTHLYLIQCYFSFDPKTLFNIMNDIWSLSDLRHCSLDLSFESDCYLITPTIISCSIQYLSIRGFRCGLENLHHLYEHTPFLQNLSIDIWEPTDDHQQLSVISSLTTCKFKCQTSSRLISSFLRKIPNLTSLTVETKILNMDGRMWEDIISKCLPKLKEFNLKMEFKLVEYDNMGEGIDRLVNSYRTPFWIDQHKWFIRCYWNVEDEDRNIYLHTLPYKFKHFSIDVNDNDEFMFESTCSQDDHYLLYNSVRTLDYCYTISQDMILSRIQFQNIRYLALTLPYNEHFQSIVPQLENLVSLQIKMVTWCHNENNLLQLQSLLDQAPRLYYLKFHSWSSVFSKGEHKNKKVIIYNHSKSKLHFLSVTETIENINDNFIFCINKMIDVLFLIEYEFLWSHFTFEKG
jgi:hypothetical protein